MKWSPKIFVYKTTDSYWKIWRPTAYDMRSFEIVIGHHAIHFYRKPKK